MVSVVGCLLPRSRPDLRVRARHHRQQARHRRAQTVRARDGIRKAGAGTGRRAPRSARQGARDRQEAGRGSDPRERRVSRQHEPRNPHADERHHRDDRSGARDRPHERPARLSPHRQELERSASDARQRHPRLLENRGAAAVARAHRLRCARRRGRRRTSASASRTRETARARVPNRFAGAPDPRRRSGTPAPGPAQSGRQRDQVHRTRRSVRRCDTPWVLARRGRIEVHGLRHRDRDRPRQAVADLRAVCPGRCVDDAALRRHRTGAGDLHTARRVDGWTDLDRQRGGHRQPRPFRRVLRRPGRSARSPHADAGGRPRWPARPRRRRQCHQPPHSRIHADRVADAALDRRQRKGGARDAERGV